VFEIENEYESALDTDEIADDSSRGQRRPSENSRRRELQLSKVVPRARLTSSVNHAEFQSTSPIAPSPLAQVFNPVLDGNTQLPPDKRPRGISFGPATRRRVSSTPLSQLQASERSNQDQMQTFPSRQSRSPSPIDDDEPPSKGGITRAGDELENGGLDLTIIQRLDAMEHRHQRIEDLLLQLSQSVSGIKVSHS
jgi:hypothetical protein